MKKQWETVEGNICIAQRDVFATLTSEHHMQALSCRISLGVSALL